MKARLLENRRAYAKSNTHAITLKAGAIILITGIDEDSGRMIAEYKGLYVLNITQDQAEPIDEEGSF